MQHNIRCYFSSGKDQYQLRGILSAPYFIKCLFTACLLLYYLSIPSPPLSVCLSLISSFLKSIFSKRQKQLYMGARAWRGRAIVLHMLLVAPMTHAPDKFAAAPAKYGRDTANRLHNSACLAMVMRPLRLRFLSSESLWAERSLVRCRGGG